MKPTAVGLLPVWHEMRTEYCLYVVEFHDGAVKVGVTKNPAIRIPALKSRYKRRPVRVHLAPYADRRGTAAERDALNRCAAIGQCIDGAELFAGISFGAAATIVQQVARRKHARLAPYSQTKEGRRAAQLRKLAQPATATGA